jgi:hypothetical protein
MPLPEQVVFHAVSEHDALTEEAHRPVRKRRHDHADASDQPAALQLVETQVAAAAPAMEDELPHRTKPRRRRGGPVVEEPLKLVETQPGTEVRTDGQP